MSEKIKDVYFVKLTAGIKALFLAIAVLVLTPFASFAESGKCERYFKLYEEAFEIPDNILRAIGLVESGRWDSTQRKNTAWPWTINVNGRGYFYESKTEAIRAVEKFRSQGYKSIDVGCMQINLNYHPEAFHDLHQAFEPKYNIGYAAEFLRQRYRQTGDWRTAVGHYHNRNPLYGTRYIKRVYGALEKENKSMRLASLDKSGRDISSMISIKTAEEEGERPDISDITRSAIAKFGRRIN